VTTSPHLPELYRQLATLAAGGVPLVQGMAKLESIAPRPLRAVCRRLTPHLQSGCSFAEAAEREPGLFAEYDRRLIAAGEQGGSLDRVLRLMADEHEAARKLQRRLEMALLYPLLLLHAAALLPAMVAYVQEGFPSAVLTASLVLVPTYLLLTLAFLAIMARSQKGPASIAADSLLLGIPFLGSYLKHLAVSRTCFALSVLLDAGCRNEEATARAAETCGSPLLRQRMEQQLDWIATGSRSPVEALIATDLADTAASAILAAGETAGRHQESLEYAATACREAAASAALRLSIVLPALAYIAAVLLIVFQIFRMLAPIFNAFNSLDL
jgi:type II secretory pathway component PulF